MVNAETFLNRIFSNSGILDFPTFHSYLITVELTDNTCKDVDLTFDIAFTVKSDLTELFDHNVLKYQLHYSQEHKTVAIYFYNGKRGWYINQKEIIHGWDVLPCIGHILTERFEMMKEIFQREKALYDSTT
jgi:hypothetical protein